MRRRIQIKNIHIVVAVLSDNIPFSYISDNNLTGYAIELVTIFARECDYSVRYEQVTSTSALAGIATGQYDIIASSLSVTKERKETIDFSDTIYEGGIVLVVRSSDLNKNTEAEQSENADDNIVISFLENIRQSFYRNFIREQRWKLIIVGIGTTCFITFLSVIAGSLVALLICLFRRTEREFAPHICNVYVKLL